MKIQILRSSLVVAALIAVSSVVHPAEPPTAAPEQSVLDRHLGSWRCTHKLLRAEWTPQEKEATAEYTFTRVLGGQFVQGIGRHSDKTEEMLVLTYDAQKKCYRRWAFHSTGQTSEFTGRWDAGTATLTWTSVDKLPFTTTFKVRLTEDDPQDYDFVVVESTGKVLFRMEGEAVRVKEPKK